MVFAGFVQQRERSKGGRQGVGKERGQKIPRTGQVAVGFCGHGCDGEDGADAFGDADGDDGFDEGLAEAAHECLALIRGGVVGLGD